MLKCLFLIESINILRAEKIIKFRFIDKTRNRKIRSDKIFRYHIKHKIALGIGRLLLENVDVSERLRPNSEKEISVYS